MADNQEFIYASYYVKDDRRSVCGWILGVQNEIDDACMWYLDKQAGDVIYYKKFGEYFYATSLNDGDNKDNRRKTACWHKGNVVSQAFFKLR
ncbi:hypothetical protein [Pectobacterium zantedeschiae]|uniref:hypothetical protein n=1 Tax=Pectobacterium zantedeschiae TaxID=2034769 RepID=UPI00101B96FA|nr:hypothetical protein [Pectobacterium zantedeschiae]